MPGDILAKAFRDREKTNYLQRCRLLFGDNRIMRKME
jgi:hypothetical protein